MIRVTDSGAEVGYTFEDLLAFHGGSSPGGVAHAYKVLERALPLLAEPGGLCERSEIVIATAFAGPGARDGFECATGAVSGGRFTVDRALRRPALGVARERFVFVLSARTTTVTLVLRDGFVTDEFAALAFKADRTSDEEARLTVLKDELATALMAARADAVYDVEVG